MSLEALKLLVSSGSKIDRALRVAVEQAPPGKLRYVLATIAEETVGGNFAASFGQFPNVFPEAVIEILKANQATGDIEEGLKQACKYYQGMEDIRSNAARGLFIPAIGFTAFAAAFCTIFGFTLPRFKIAFQEITPIDKMPGLSQMLFAISDFFVAHVTFIILSIVLFVWGGRLLLQQRRVRRVLMKGARRVPIVGPAMRATALARLCITYSNLAKNGFKTIGILEICARVVSDPILADAITRVRNAILENVVTEVGEGFTKEGKAFPPEFLTAVSIAQNNLPKIFKKLARYYKREAEKKTDMAVRAIEPAMTVFLFVFVVIAGAGLILPITQIFNRL